MGKEYNAIKVGGWYVVCNLLVKCIPFFSLPIFTRLLSTSDFGVFNTYLAYETIFSVIFTLGLSGTIKMAKYEFEKCFEEYVSSIVCLILIIGSVALFLFQLGYAFFPFTGVMSNNVCNILILHCVSVAIYNVVSNKYIITGEYKKNIFSSVLMTVLNVALSVFLCFRFFENERFMARIVGTAVSVMLVAMLNAFLQFRQKISFKGIFVKFGLRYGVPLIAHYLSLSLLSQVDKIMISNMVGNVEAGIYSFGVNIMAVMTVITSAIDNAWAPWFYKELNQRNFNNIEKNNNKLVFLFLYLICGFLLICPELITILSTEEYYDSIYSLVPLIISVFINFMYLFSVNLEYYYKKSWYISISTIIAAGANVLLNYLFIIEWGHIAAAYATCISKLILFILHYVKARKLESEKVISLKVLLIGLSIAILCGGLCLVFLEAFLVRYILVLILLCLGFFGGYNFLKKKHI